MSHGVPLSPGGSEVRSIERGAIGTCVWLLRVTSAAMLLFIMGLTFVDVCTSYFLNSPITGSAELVMFAMAILIFSAFPLVTAREQHISVSLLHGRFTGFWLWLQRFVTLAVSLVACASMSWQLMHDGRQLISDQQVTVIRSLPLGPLSYFMSAMSGASALALLVVLLRHLRSITPRATARTSS